MYRQTNACTHYLLPRGTVRVVQDPLHKVDNWGVSAESPAACFPKRDNAINFKVSVPIDTNGGAGVASTGGTCLHLIISWLEAEAIKVETAALALNCGLALKIKNVGVLF